MAQLRRSRRKTVDGGAVFDATPRTTPKLVDVTIGKRVASVPVVVEVAARA